MSSSFVISFMNLSSSNVPITVFDVFVVCLFFLGETEGDRAAGLRKCACAEKDTDP